MSDEPPEFKTRNPPGFYPKIGLMALILGISILVANTIEARDPTIYAVGFGVSFVGFLILGVMNRLWGP